MELVDQTVATIQKIWLRLRLPGLLAQEPLDVLLMRLTAAGRRKGDFASLERAVDRAEALVERAPGLPRTCRYRCLARYAVFHRHGFRSEFVMAISPRGTDEAGHAWLEFQGKPYREEHAREFVVSYRYPACAA